MIKVLNVRPLAGHHLYLRFSDGTYGYADLRSHMEREPFLEVLDVFDQVILENGAVEWPCGVGIATEALYALVHGLPKPETLEQALANERALGGSARRRALQKGFRIVRDGSKLVLTGDMYAHDRSTMLEFLRGLPEGYFVVEAADATVDPGAVTAWIESVNECLTNHRLDYEGSQLAMILAYDARYTHSGSTFKDPDSV